MFSQIFWFPLILEGFLAVLAILLFRSAEAASRKGSLSLGEIIERSDPVGTGLSIPGLILLVYALTTGNQSGWSDASVIGTLVAAVVLLLAFVFVEKKLARYPFVPRHLWKTSSLGVGCALAAITYAVWQGANYFLTLQLQGQSELLRSLLSQSRQPNVRCRSRLYSVGNFAPIPATGNNRLFDKHGYPASTSPCWAANPPACQLAVRHYWCHFVHICPLDRRLLAFMRPWHDLIHCRGWNRLLCVDGNRRHIGFSSRSGLCRRRFQRTSTVLSKGNYPRRLT